MRGPDDLARRIERRPKVSLRPSLMSSATCGPKHGRADEKAPRRRRCRFCQQSRGPLLSGANACQAFASSTVPFHSPLLPSSPTPRHFRRRWLFRVGERSEAARRFHLSGITEAARSAASQASHTGLLCAPLCLPRARGACPLGFF